jgi:N-carbamoylputrescine amidase
MRIGLAQIAPGLGQLEANLARHAEVIAHARSQAVNLLVFPELGLTGYLLQELNAEVAMACTDPRLAGLASLAGQMSLVVGFVEESDDHRLLIAAALLEEGAVRSVTRKAFLPNYGLFDERRFFGAAERVEAVDSALGVRLGISICEDFWHLPTAYLLALDGAQVLVNISSSPGRDVAAAVEGGLGTADAWRPLLRTYAMLTTSFVVYVNRVGVEESVTFWGGSEVIDPSGHTLFRAPLHEDGLFVVDIDTDDLRRERLALPVLRDERPEMVLRQLERIVRQRAGVDEDPAE